MKKAFIFLALLLLTLLAFPRNAAANHSLTAIRIGLESHYANASSIAILNAEIYAGDERLSSQGGFTAYPSGGGVSLHSGGGEVSFANAQTITDAYGGPVVLESGTYRGAVELSAGGNGISAVNILTLDEYLYSVVPYEMPPHFHPEALKAQTVAARSYTLTLLDAHSEQGYHLCDKAHCQAYPGAEREDAASTLAVQETAGQTAYYNGEPINAVYFSSSGGATDNAENVWVEETPYLRGVAEIQEFEPMVWTRAFTLDEITALLTVNNDSIGAAAGIEITRISPLGRVQELTIYGSQGSKSLVKEEIRTFFSSSAEGSLESRYFVLGSQAMNGTIQPPVTQPGGTDTGAAGQTAVTVTDGIQVLAGDIASMYGISVDGRPVILDGAAAYNGVNEIYYGGGTAEVIETIPASGGQAVYGDVVFSGRGWGHGVGMSQRGAEGMARLGYGYIDILKHYYTGIAVE